MNSAPSAGVVPFGDIFDLQALSLHLNGPILEWRDVKALPKKARDDAYSTSAVEELGCWTTRKENSPDPTRAYNLVRHLGVDVSYTRVPMSTRYDPSDREDDHVAFPELAALVYPRDPMLNVGSLTALAPSQAGHASVPENHLACFDTLYYATSGTRRFEWEYTWSPAWRTIGRHLGFTVEVKDIARSYLADAFGIGGRAMADIPPVGVSCPCKILSHDFFSLSQCTSGEVISGYIAQKTGSLKIPFLLALRTKNMSMTSKVNFWLSTVFIFPMYSFPQASPVKSADITSNILIIFCFD